MSPQITFGVTFVVEQVYMSEIDESHQSVEDRLKDQLLILYGLVHSILQHPDECFDIASLLLC